MDDNVATALVANIRLLRKEQRATFQLVLRISEYLDLHEEGDSSGYKDQSWDVEPELKHLDEKWW